MNISDRISHPSMPQLETLVEFLEGRPQLAKGFLRHQSARVKSLKEWEYIAAKLNRVAGGCLKNAKKWMKYWSDKKSAVKKKAMRTAAIKKNGGELDDLPEISEIEERIISLLVAAGDVHLRIQVLGEPVLTTNDCPSLLVEHSGQIIDPSPTTSSPHQVNTTWVYEEPPEMKPFMVKLLPSTSPQPSPPTPPRPSTPPSVSSPTVVVTPTDQRSPVYRNSYNAVHENPSTMTNERLRRFRAIRRPPPFQRRSQFSSITERLLKIEERRLNLEYRFVSLLERHTEVDRLMAQAVFAVGEGLKSLADATRKTNNK